MKRYLNILGVVIFFVSLLGACTFERNHSLENEQVSDSLRAAIDTTWININERIKKNPSDLSLFHERANYLFSKGESLAAIADMRRIIGIDSTNAAYYYTLAELLFTQGNGGGVMKALEKCLQIEPNNVEAKMKLAELQLYLQKYKECLKELDEVLKLDKYLAKAYFIKGMAFKEIGDTAKAVSSFQTTVEQDPDYFHAYMQLGLLYSKAKNHFAIDYFKSAIQLNSKSTEAYYALGIFLQENGQPEQALEVYNANLEFDPNNKNLHYNIGYVFSEYLKDYTAAIEAYSKAIQLAPDFHEAYYMRGYSHERGKNKKNAEEDYRFSLKLNPDYTLAAKGMNRVY